MSQTLTSSPEAEALIFDLDGTLLDSLGLHWRAWHEAFSAQGVEIDHELFLTYTGKPVEEIAQILIDHYGADVDINAILKAKKDVVASHLNEVEEIEAVTRVARENYGKKPMAVGTGSDRARAELMLKNAGLFHMFDAIVSADDVEHFKPEPDTFLLCARRMGVAPEKCQVFEDGEPGLEAARRCGMIATDVKPYYKK